MISLSVYRQLVAALCVVGVGLSFYAFYVETRKVNDPSYKAACDISERMSCSRVLTSRWARGFGLFESDSIFNIPDALFALIYYFLSFVLNQSYRSKTIARLRVILSVATNLGSIYLGYILYFVLNDVCLVCCGMYILNFTILICNFKLLPLTNADKHQKKKQ